MMSALFGVKIALISTLDIEKIIGQHEFLDRQTDSFSALYIDKYPSFYTKKHWQVI